MDALLDALIRLAQQLQEKHGFHPFGGSVNSRGEVSIDGAYTGGEHPEPQEVIQVLYGGLTEQAQREDIRAAGVCTDVRLSEPIQSDAISVSLEPVDAEPIVVNLPYKRRRFRGFEYGDIVATPGERRAFA